MTCKVHYKTGTILFALVLIFSPQVFANAISDTNFTNSAINATASVYNNTNLTLTSNVTTTNGSIYVANPINASIPSNNISAGTSGSLAGTEIFANGTLITSVNGVSMKFYFDPSKPSNSTTNSTPTTQTGTSSSIVLNSVQTTSGTVSAPPYQITLSNFNVGTGSNRALIVGVEANNNYANSITFNGIQLTKASSSFHNNDAEFWYLKNPSGTGNIVVTMSGPTSAIIGAYSFFGIDQTNTIPTIATNYNAAPGSPTISITTKYQNSWVIDLPSIWGGVTLVNPSCIQQWDINIAGKITGASSTTSVASPMTVTCNWTSSGGGDLWDDVAIEIQASNSTSATAPQSPTGLTATAISSSQINLSWTAPNNNGGSPITGYKIERSNNGGSSWSTIASNTGSVSTTYSDTGLASNTTYYYRVSAINSVGTSTPSNTGFATTTGGNSRSINQISSGLVASDSLTNETMTQQQLQSNPGYWAYAGDAPAFNAPYKFYRDSQGLHIGVQAPKSGSWAGFFAESPNHNAALWHAIITTPVRTISSSTDSYENGLYVQTSNGLINYVTCVSLTNNQATVWAIISTTGNTNQATNFKVLWIDNSANQPLTRDCTIITNGDNYLTVYLDGTMVYSSTILKLQMPAPFNAYLEPETSYAGAMLVGTFQNYYVTTTQNVMVINNPSNVTRVDVADLSGKVLASASVSGGTASIDISKYDFPMQANIKAYDTNNSQIASTANPVNIYGGNVYSVG